MQKLKCFFYMTTVLLAGLFVTSMVFEHLLMTIYA